MTWRVLAVFILAAFFAGACGPERGRREPAIVLLGVDGFDWNIIDPLVEAGRMPVMKRLQEMGTRADLLTLVPLEKSPVIWTTIATGKLPEEKGRGFLAPSEGGAPQSYASWQRQSRAFWNILPDHGYSVSVLGWLETWPAEEVGGTIVSDYVQYDMAGKMRGEGHRTHPPSLFEEIRPLVVYSKDLPSERLEGFITREKAVDPADPEIEKGLDDLRWILAGDLTFTALAREFLRHRKEDVMAIYLRGPDAACHKFWGDRENLERGNVTMGLAAVFGETVDRYFEETDRMIGEILSEIDLARTTLVLVSDHGFQGGRRGLDGSARLGIWMHRELGTVLVVGPFAASAGGRAEGARVQDVLPTVLHALGLPVADDMDGDVARSLLSARGGRDREGKTIPTYETGEPPRVPAALDTAVAEEIDRRVRSLGYVN